MSQQLHPVSAERIEEVVQMLLGFMDQSGICIAEGRIAMTRLLASFTQEDFHETHPSHPA